METLLGVAETLAVVAQPVLEELIEYKKVVAAAAALAFPQSLRPVRFRQLVSPLLIISWQASGQSTLLPAVTSTQNTLTSSPIALSSTSTGGSSNKLSTNRVQPSISSSSTPRSTASVLYNADSSGGTSTVSIGVPPNGTSGIASTKPGSNAGVIAGTVIFSVFILLIFAFLLHRRRVRNRIAPSAQYLAEYGPRPLSWAPAFFSRRASSGYYDISHFNISSIVGIYLDLRVHGLTFVFSGKGQILNLVIVLSVLMCTSWKSATDTAMSLGNRKTKSIPVWTFDSMCPNGFLQSKLISCLDSQNGRLDSCE